MATQARYGKKIREGFRKARKKSEKKYQCPKCSRLAVKRISEAVWKCKKCSAKFSSGTYEFKL